MNDPIIGIIYKQIIAYQLFEWVEWLKGTIIFIYFDCVWFGH